MCACTRTHTHTEESSVQDILVNLCTIKDGTGDGLEKEEGQGEEGRGKSINMRTRAFREIGLRHLVCM